MYTVKYVIIFRWKLFLFLTLLRQCVLPNHVPENTLKPYTDGIAETIFFRTLKALTHYMQHMQQLYNNPIGCGYAIEYPCGESITTDLWPCFQRPILF
ncbi:hypothetical protein ACRPOS_001235 [Bartonella heixiaziensis]|uniref:hypothetical protein n=1 Tax=Bartonella heixiaziensis TaxID=1461000 RepID=UPI003908A1CA